MSMLKLKREKKERQTKTFKSYLSVARTQCDLLFLFFHTLLLYVMLTSLSFPLNLAKRSPNECVRATFFSISNEKISKLHPMKIYVYICGAVILTPLNAYEHSTANNRVSTSYLLASNMKRRHREIDRT